MVVRGDYSSSAGETVVCGIDQNYFRRLNAGGDLFAINVDRLHGRVLRTAIDITVGHIRVPRQTGTERV